MKSISDKLAAGGRPVHGPWLMTPSPAFVELCGAMGMDFVLADMEHGELDLSVIATLTRAAAIRQLPMIVRVPDQTPSMVSRVLDRGAAGVMVPRVESAQTARAIVEAARYAPLGSRGIAVGAVRGSGYGSQQDYVERSSRETVVIAQIESRAGIAAAEAIGATPHLSMIFFGPNDLAGELGGSGVDDPLVWRAIDDVRKRLPSGLSVGTIATPQHPAEVLARDGYGMIIEGSDITAMRTYLQQLALRQPGAGQAGKN